MPDGTEIAVEARPIWSLRRGNLEGSLLRGVGLMNSFDNARFSVGLLRCLVVLGLYGTRVTYLRLLASCRRDRSWRVQVVREVDRLPVSTLLCGSREEALGLASERVEALQQQGGRLLRYAQWHSLIPPARQRLTSGG